MNGYPAKVFLLHSFIMAGYITLTSYLFVTGKEANPIGAGLGQWACLFLHFFITLFITLSPRKTGNGKVSWKRAGFHAGLILGLFLLVLLLNEPIWEWLWQLRSAGH